MGAKGCSGACGREHPRIYLTWQSEEEKAMITLSHALDPFLTYLEDLVSRGVAKRTDSPLIFEIDCFVQEFLQQWDTPLPPPRSMHKKQSTVTEHPASLPSSKFPNIPIFGKHLVKVDAHSVEASFRSERAYKRRLQNEHEARRRCRQKGAPIEEDLLYQVLDICAQNSLGQILDTVEIAWMRCTGHPAMVKIAARLAKLRLQASAMTVQFLWHGVLCHGFPSNVPLRKRRRGHIHKRDGETETEFLLAENDMQCMTFTALGSPETTPRLLPSDKCGFFSPSRPDNERIEYTLSTSTPQPKPNLIRVFLECPDSCRPVEVARYRLSGEDLSRDGIIQVSATTSQSPSLFLQNRIVHRREGDALGWTGYLSIQQMRFDFGDLLGIHVRRKLPLAFSKLQEIQCQRPATRSERQYVKALAKAAREAPGTSSDFEGYEGW